MNMHFSYIKFHFKIKLEPYRFNLRRLLSIWKYIKQILIEAS